MVGTGVDGPGGGLGEGNGLVRPDRQHVSGEGDVVRIMRRTVDLLAQVPYCEAISEQLRSHARQALRAINRFPVAEAEDLLKQAGEQNPATERAA